MRAKNNHYLLAVCFVVLSWFLTVNSTFGQVEDDTVYIWYGNLDETPVIALIGDTIYIDVYLYTTENTYLADLHLCLGAMDQCVENFLYGVIHYPFGPDAGFGQPEGSPPNPPGWSSQSFVWYADLMGPIWLHFDIPTLIISFRVVLVNDPSLMGDTIECLGPGINSTLGGSAAGDTLGMFAYPMVEHFSPIYFVPIPDTCNYALLDFDCDCIPDTGNYSIITYWIRYFKGVGADTLPCYCWDNYHNRWLYSPGDVNGSCRFCGADILYLIAYFSGRVDEILWCPYTPPGCD